MNIDIESNLRVCDVLFILRHSLGTDIWIGNDDGFGTKLENAPPQLETKPRQ